jgi:hypothetical protein
MPQCIPSAHAAATFTNSNPDRGPSRSDGRGSLSTIHFFAARPRKTGGPDELHDQLVPVATNKLSLPSAGMWSSVFSAGYRVENPSLEDILGSPRGYILWTARLLLSTIGLRASGLQDLNERRYQARKDPKCDARWRMGRCVASCDPVSEAWRASGSNPSRRRCRCQSKILSAARL